MAWFLLGFAAGVVGVLSYLLFTLLLQRWRRRQLDVVRPAEWGQPREYYLYCDENGKLNVDHFLDTAIDSAHVAQVAAGQWPHEVRVYADGFGTTSSRRVVYSYCVRCGYCTHRDDKERCRPCTAATLVTKDPDKQRELSREFTQREYPQWISQRLKAYPAAGEEDDTLPARLVYPDLREADPQAGPPTGEKPPSLLQERGSGWED